MMEVTNEWFNERPAYRAFDEFCQRYHMIMVVYAGLGFRIEG